MKKRSLALLLALVLALGCAVGGTLAWLTATSDKVENKFTTSDIGVTLEETTTEYKMIPGYTIAKDPKASVTEGSEPAWLFVKIEKSNDFDSFMTYEVAEGWTAGNGADIPANVVYRKVTTADIGTVYSVLENDQVSVRDTVTKAQMDALTADTYPTLTFTAYASQLYKSADVEFTAAEAWTVLNPTNP